MLPLTLTQIAQLARPSVVQIRADDAVGSGFVVRDDGTIATNLHLVSGASEAVIVLPDGQEIDDIEVLAADADHDLVLLRSAEAKLPSLTLDDSDDVTPGERVVAVGSSAEPEGVVSEGLLSAVREIAEGLQVLQISAELSEDASGGPLLNERGQVIGVATLVVSQGKNLSFAIPANAIRPLLDNQEGVPLADFSWPGRRRRSVPQHDASLLEGCKPAELNTIVKAIKRAISVGAPLYNEGHHDACFRIYQGTALDLDRRLTGCAGPRRALMDGVRKAESLSDASDRAWAMRDAFDGVLAAVEEHGELPSSSSARLPSPPKRQVPVHPTSLLGDATSEAVERIDRAISSAISVGAPLYNEGQFEACFRIYETAILELDRTLQGSHGARKALTDGLAEAERRESFSDKAWALRDAFDGMLDVIARGRLN